MSLLRDTDREALKKLFQEKLQGPVKMVLFTQAGGKIVVPGEIECPACEETRTLLEEVSALSDKITLEVHDFRAEKEKAAEMGVEMIPAIIVDGKRPGSVRFYGIPAGYEFATLAGMLIDASKGGTDLQAESKQALGALKDEIHIQVFVTPTCPYCPMAARLAHQAAMETDKVRADVIEVSEFPHLVQRYSIRGVPKTVFSDKVSLEGAVPEPVFIQQLVAAGGAEMPASS